MEQERQGSLLVALGLAIGFAGAAVAAAEVTGIALFDHGADAAVTSHLVSAADDRKAMRPCDISIAQFGPSERWLRHFDVYECASAARDLPAYVLTWPLGAK